MLILRDMIETDIEDYVEWFTKDTEWGDWDAPWEEFEGDEESERQGWTEYFQSVKDLPKDVTRWKFEIESEGVHIGWVSAYEDLEYVENKENIPAIGIDIPNINHRKHGNGTLALQMFIDYYVEKGYKSLYTQTWSGNHTMLRVAEKLGFKEVYREKNYREVNGEKYDALLLRLNL